METTMNEKETYQIPTIQVIEMEVEHEILQASGTESPYYDWGTDL